MSLFGQYIKDAREENGLSLSAAADLIGCTKAHLWELERGRSNNPTVKTLVGIARALDLRFETVALAAAESATEVLIP